MWECCDEYERRGSGWREFVLVGEEGERGERVHT